MPRSTRSFVHWHESNYGFPSLVYRCLWADLSEHFRKPSYAQSSCFRGRRWRVCFYFLPANDGSSWPRPTHLQTLDTPRSSGSASLSNSPKPARRLRVHAVLGTAASGQYLSWALSLAAPRRICRRALAFCKKSLATAFMAIFFSHRRSRVYQRRFPACSRLVGARCRRHPILRGPVYVWVFAFLGRDRGDSTASWLLFARRCV